MNNVLDVEKLINDMSLEEKVSIVSGLGFWHTRPFENHGIPSIMVSDGPHGTGCHDLSFLNVEL